MILEIVFNVLMKLCPWGSFFMKIFFIVSIFGDSHCEEFLFLEIFRGGLFFKKNSPLRLFHYEDFFNAQLEAKKLF